MIRVTRREIPRGAEILPRQVDRDMSLGPVGEANEGVCGSEVPGTFEIVARDGPRDPAVAPWINQKERRPLPVVVLVQTDPKPDLTKVVRAMHSPTHLLRPGQSRHQH